ncbi:hypothetical protein HJC23_009856 [Cyclotella cryptica]|uniref:Methyltransferase FkbM domain-containing protein n=1 Tax=Cyclotella cryptica TaxID=29204 RepID=A0ABD3QBP3_9STRA
MFEAFDNFQEPLQRVKEENNGLVDFKIQVLSGEDNQEVKFWQEGATGNSMFPQLYGRGGRGHSDIQPVTKITMTLDTARRESSFLKGERVDVLKLDVQGAELSVLRGAAELLKEVTFVQFEASVIEYNKGGSCLFEIDNLLRSQGFYLYNIADIQRDPGLFHTYGTGQFDALYIRPTSEHLPRAIQNIKPNMCGSDGTNRPGFSSDLVSTLSITAETADTPSEGISNGHTISKTREDTTGSFPKIYWIGYAGALLVGFLLGRSKVMSKRDRKFMPLH